MKKATALLTTMLMIISLAACGSGSSNSGQTFGNGNTSFLPNTQNSVNSQNNSLPQEDNSLPVEDDSQSEDESWDGEYIYGQIGDTLSTVWFDFNVTSATLYSEYNGITPSDGYQLLVLEMWLKNTYVESVPMFIYDFDVEWDDPDSYETPISMTVDGKELTEEEYSLRRSGSADLVMVYEVAEGYEDFFVFFDEDFANGTVGDVFAVYLIPEQG